MEGLDAIRALIDYHYSLYSRVWESVEQLTEEQFHQDLKYSHGSIRDQLVHVINTDASWLKGLEGDPEARKFRIEAEEFPTRQALKELWEEVAVEVRGYVESLSQEDLDRVPPRFRGPTWQVLLHLVIHGTDHRAQILQGLHALGASTFDQDLIFHLWRRT